MSDGSFHTEDGQVRDKDIAHDIANTWDKQGVSAGLAREKFLKSTEEAGGFTPDQQENIKLIDALKEMYPNAMTEKVDDKGRKSYLTNTISRSIANMVEVESGQGIYSRVLLTPYGFLTLKDKGFAPELSNQLLDKANFTSVVDRMVDPQSGKINGEIIPIQTTNPENNSPIEMTHFLGFKWNRDVLASSSPRKEEFKKLLSVADNITANTNEVVTAATRMKTADSILANF